MKTVEQFVKEVSPFGTLTVGNPKFIEALKVFVDQPIYEGKTPAEMAEINAADLREMAHYYGGWDELIKIIDNMKERDNEAAYDRQQENYDRISEGERQETQHRIQRDLK